jgi:hypothetical protein
MIKLFSAIFSILIGGISVGTLMSIMTEINTGWGDTKLEIFFCGSVTGIMYTTPFVVLLGIPWSFLAERTASFFVKRGLISSPLLIEFPFYVLGGGAGSIIAFIFLGPMPGIWNSAIISSLSFMLAHAFFRRIKNKKSQSYTELSAVK